MVSSAQAESNVIMVEVTIVKLPQVVVLLLQRNFVRRVSLGKRTKSHFGPIRPKGHVHGVVQLDGGGQLGTGLFPPAKPGTQHTETEVTVGLERTHAELLSKCHSLLVSILRLFDLRGLLMYMDFAEQPKSPGLVPALLTLTAQSERAPSELSCIIPAPS
jgi:hypothetical protein